jgi:hypothetical protein
MGAHTLRPKMGMGRTRGKNARCGIGLASNCMARLQLAASIAASAALVPITKTMDEI